MTWFTASIITYLKEDFILFESDTRAGAMNKARTDAIELVASDDSTFFESCPVKRVFAGRDELSHSYFELNSEDEIKRLAGGEVLTVFYRDDQ
jgi:hypothetical protein